MRRLVVLPLVLAALFGPAAGASAAAGDGSTPPSATGWVQVDAPVHDFGDDGWPYRLTVALPSRRDPLSRLLRASEARWTLSTGYARVRDSYDAATGVFKNPGGHAALFGAARQFRWHPPASAGPAVPRALIEFGVHYATRRFPADGTRFNLLLVTGLEWSWRTRDASNEWSAAIVWPHFSNAGLFRRNAGYDGLALRLGRSVRF